MRSFISSNSRVETNLPPSTSAQPSKPELCSEDHRMGLAGLSKGRTSHAPQGAQTQPVHTSNSLSGEKSSQTHHFSGLRWVGLNHASDLQVGNAVFFRNMTQQRWHPIAVEAIILTANHHAMPLLITQEIQLITWAWGKFTMNMEGQKWDLVHNIWHPLKDNTLFIILGAQDSIPRQQMWRKKKEKNHRLKEKVTLPCLSEDTSSSGLILPQTEDALAGWH